MLLSRLSRCLLAFTLNLRSFVSLKRKRRKRVQRMRNRRQRQYLKKPTTLTKMFGSQSNAKRANSLLPSANHLGIQPVKRFEKQNVGQFMRITSLNVAMNDTRRELARGDSVHRPPQLESSVREKESRVLIQMTTQQPRQ